MHMTVESRRSKMVTFRVSMDEYRSLEAACMARHVRSISELAREALQQWVRETAVSSQPDGALQEVERRIQMLAEELDRLQRLVRFQKIVPRGEIAAQ